jgi:hypothetical protein
MFVFDMSMVVFSKLSKMYLIIRTVAVTDETKG